MSNTLCHIDDIPEGNSKGFNLEGVNLFAVKKDGKISIYLNRCPHLGIPLEWQNDQFLDNEAGFIKCSNHGALFVLETGECVQGPCLGDSLWEIPFSIENRQIMVNEEDLPELSSPA